MLKSDGIIGKLIENVGLFKNIFGKYSDDIIFDQDIEKAKNYLKIVYKKTDVDELFPPIIDNDKYNSTLKTIFTYYGNNENGTEGKK